MAGVVGGGGIGDLTIRYGYYRFDNFTMWDYSNFINNTCSKLHNI